MQHMKINPLTGSAKSRTKISHAARAFEAAMAVRSVEKFFLRLYVAGATPRSRLAVRRVYQLCEAEMKGNYDLEVIDVYQQPKLARENQIVATPTLIREFPRPVRRYVGNLSNTESLFFSEGGEGMAGPVRLPKNQRSA